MLQYINYTFVSDECPFGDQPVLPGSVGCGDRVYGRPYDCYLPSLNAACCASCGEIKTDITGTSPKHSPFMIPSCKTC